MLIKHVIESELFEWIDSYFDGGNIYQPDPGLGASTWVHLDRAGEVYVVGRTVPIDTITVYDDRNEAEIDFVDGDMMIAPLDLNLSFRFEKVYP